MFQMSGIKCHVCGMALENSRYVKDEHGSGLYWVNARNSPHTDVNLNFCGVYHSAEWYKGVVGAKQTPVQNSDQTAG